MESLVEGLYAIGESLYVEALDLLVVSDLQLGQEEELRSQGALVLDRELSSMKERLGRAIRESGASRLLINGDLKHEFSRISRQEWNHVLSLFDFFSEQGVEVVLVRGNHDTMLEPIVKKRGYELYDYFLEDGFLFVHGHEIPPEDALAKAHTIVIGHEHPAVRLSDGVRSELVKCYLVGPWHDHRLVILPSLSENAVGTDVLSSAGLGPFSRDREELRVFVLSGDEVLSFSRVRDLKEAFL